MIAKGPVFVLGYEKSGGSARTLSKSVGDYKVMK